MFVEIPDRTHAFFTAEATQSLFLFRQKESAYPQFIQKISKTREWLTARVKKEISGAGAIDHHYAFVLLATQSHENREGFLRGGCPGALAFRCRSGRRKTERRKASPGYGKVCIGTEARGVNIVKLGNKRR
jgi:hypothetical protein